MGPSKTITFSDDHKFLVTSSNHSAASVWDIGNKRLLKRLGSNSSYLKAINFSKDEKLALLNTDNEVWIWDVKNGKPIFSVPSIRTRSVDECILNNDNSLLFIKSRKINEAKFDEGNALILDLAEDNDYRLEVFNTESNIQEKNYHLPLNYYRHAVSPDGKNAIITCLDSTGYVINISSGKTLQNFKNLNFIVSGLDYTKDGKQIVMIGDNRFTLYDNSTFQKLISFEESSDIASYGYDPVTGIVVIVLANRKIIIRNTSNGALIKEINDYEDKNVRLGYSNISIFQYKLYLTNRVTISVLGI